MSIDLRPALIITRREVRDQFRDWRIIFPVLILTLIFPSLMNFTAAQIVGFVERHNAPLIGERLIPFLLMVVGFFPISVSLVIALESFVGEKERRSIEPLLGSPLTDWQLYLGKLLAAMVPPLLASMLGITVYLVSVYLDIGWKPSPSLLIQIVLLTIVQATVMVSGAVVISTQTTSVRAANLLASFIIIPMSFLIQGESMVMFWAVYSVLWWALLGELVIAGLLIRTGVVHFNREELLGKELDTLNFGWGWRVFRNSFTGTARSVWAWYRYEIPQTLRRMALPTVFVVIALGIGIWAGVSLAPVYVLPRERINFTDLDQSFVTGLEAINFFTPGGAVVVWLHNLRVVALATALGIFSFGVLGILVLMLPMMIIGYFAGATALAGFSPLLFLEAFVLPHGVLEIPAIILTGAAVLRLGATLAAPAKGGQTIGEAWLQALGDWARLILGVVIPLFLGAALIEVLITPRIAVWLLGG